MSSIVGRIPVRVTEIAAQKKIKIFFKADINVKSG